jgi:hypothetical protein
MKQIATIVSEARDCDGMHYGKATYEMLDEELASQFSDLEFHQRIVGYMVSTISEEGTLTVRQHNGMPVFEWSERTDEGYRYETATFSEE